MSDVGGDLFWVGVGSVATAVGSIATAFGVFVAVQALRGAGKQIEDTRKVAEETKRIAAGQFLLRLDELLQQHNEIHVLLRPGGAWADTDQGPVTSEEWVKVERYMGLFERIQILIESGIVSLDVIAPLYGYRLFNLVANPIIRRKLKQEAESWTHFFHLWQGLKDHLNVGAGGRGVPTPVSANHT